MNVILQFQNTSTSPFTRSLYTEIIVITKMALNLFVKSFVVQTHLKVNFAIIILLDEFLCNREGKIYVSSIPDFCL